MTTLTLRCETCAVPFEREEKQHKSNIHRGRIHVYCSNKCLGVARRKHKDGRKFTCAFCSEDFTYYKATGGTVIKYCSPDCYSSARAAKKSLPKCIVCKKNEVQAGLKSKYCLSCLESRREEQSLKRIQTALEQNQNLSLADLKSKYSLGQYHAKLRGLARSRFIQSKRPLICLVCEYSKHTDICHIRGLADFDMSTSVAEVNDISNLMPLCRNHHWEYDHDLLDEDDKTILHEKIKAINQDI